MKTFPILVVSLLIALTPASRAGDFPGQEVGPTEKADSSKKSVKQTYHKVALTVERMRRHLEEWGTVNISNPLLYPVAGQFSLGTPAEFATFKEYYATELTNVTGSVGQLEQTVVAASGSGTFNAPQFSASPAPSPGGPGVPFAMAAPGTAIPPEPPVSQAKGYLDQPTFHKPGELIATLPNGNAPRSAVNQAATDKITELLLRNMANPPKLDENARLYLAIFQVTCNPGWRTLKGYMADVYFHWEYVDDQHHRFSLSDEPSIAPEIVGILPLVDAQNMDLRNSQRELYSLLLSLSASGALGTGNAAGKGVVDFLRSYQKDAASRNAMPVVNSYNTAYGMGFRFSPSFVAISDPAKKKSRAANVLIPTSFPVLAVIKMTKSDVFADPSRRQGLKYSELAWQSNFRWLVRDRFISLAPWNWHLPERRENEFRRVDVARHNSEARAALTRMSFMSNLPPDEYQLLLADYTELSFKTGSNWSFGPLPDDLIHAPKKPEILGYQPAVIDPSIETKMTIQGSNFKGDGLRVFLGGQECTVVSVDDEQGIIALVKAGKLATERQTIDSETRDCTDLVVATKTAAANFRVVVDLTAQKEKQDLNKKKTVQINRDPQGRIVSVDFSALGDVSAKDLLDATTKILGGEPAKPEKPDKPATVAGN